jgi:hypothetical protein
VLREQRARHPTRSYLVTASSTSASASPARGRLSLVSAAALSPGATAVSVLILLTIRRLEHRSLRRRAGRDDLRTSLTRLLNDGDRLADLLAARVDVNQHRLGRRQAASLRQLRITTGGLTIGGDVLTRLAARLGHRLRVVLLGLERDGMEQESINRARERGKKTNSRGGITSARGHQRTRATEGESRVNTIRRSRAR